MARDVPHARILIAGGGVAGVEALLALSALAAGHVDVMIVAPELRFINRSMSVAQPFRRQRGRGVRLADATAELGARRHRGALDRVERERHRVVTKDGDELSYDMLVLAIGARPEHEWRSTNLLTYSGDRSGPGYRLLLHQLLERRIAKVAFVRPPGESWPLPLYDLALMTAAECAAHGLDEVELTLVTPEEHPLEIFGGTASAAVSRLLDDAGVILHTSSHGILPSRAGWLDISPGDRSRPVDRIVTEPHLIGPRLRGVPCGSDGFIRVDEHGRVADMEDVFAGGDDSTVADEALWWPPNKLCGRYLAPYLAGQVGGAADVMPQDHCAIAGETILDPAAPAARRTSGELSDRGSP